MRINKNKFGNIGFLIIALLFAGLGIWGCCSQNSTETATTTAVETENDAQYLNLPVQIVEKGGYAERNGKYTNVGKYFLVRSTRDTTLYTELNAENFNASCGCRRGIIWEWDSMFYNHRAGDILTFDYIRKDRFWHNYNYEAPQTAKPVVVIIHDTITKPVYVKYYDENGDYRGYMPVDRAIVNHKKQTIFLGYKNDIALYAHLKDLGMTTMDKEK